MKDLIFVVKSDGTYEQVPNRNLRAQENYSDNFVVIANQVGVVKAKIRLLSRTDKVEVKYLVPSLESVEELIGDKAYFQEYAQANVWRGAVPKKLLQEISMSYAGQVEISFSFTKPVLDKRAVNNLGDLYGDLPQTADEGDYYIIKLSTYTKDGKTWTFGQQAIYINGSWIKGGTYKVIGTSITHRMNVEPTLHGEQAEFDTENEDEYLLTLQDHSDRIGELEESTDDHELRISTNEEDIDATELEIDKIKDGRTVVAKAEKDEAGRVIEDSYASKIVQTVNRGPSKMDIELFLKSPNDDNISGIELQFRPATQSLIGMMSAADKIKLDNLLTTISNNITVHDTDETAHLYLRELIGGLRSEIDRLDGKGKSYGEIAKTQSELLALGAGATVFINSDILGRYPDYSAASGDLIYTKEVVGENVHEWEYNAALSVWVDNGAYTVEKASNSEYGIVKGDGTFVSVVSGLIEVLRAKTADKLGTEVDFFTKALLDNALADRYTKAEVDNIIDLLKTINGWEKLDYGNYVHLDKIYWDEIENCDFIVVNLSNPLGAVVDSKIIPTKDLNVDGKKVILGLSAPDLFLMFNEETAPARSYLEVLDAGGVDIGNVIEVNGIKLASLHAEGVKFGETNVGDELTRLETDKADKTYVDSQLALKQNVISDSGWQSLSLGSNFTGYAYIRKIGNVVNLRGLIKSKGEAHNAQGPLIPLGYRVDYQSDIDVGGYNVIVSYGTTTSATDGTSIAYFGSRSLQFRNSLIVDRYYGFHITYLVS